MSRFLEALHSGHVLLMDGAMGTELIRAGLDPEIEPGELWNVERPERVADVHRAYVGAGAHVLLTNTFQANLWALERRGLTRHLTEIQSAALSLARAEAGPARFVIGDIGPICLPEQPWEFLDPDAISQFVPALGSSDALLLETCSGPNALLAVEHCHLVSRARDLPVLLSLTYQRRGPREIRAFSGHAPEWFAERSRKVGVAALGVNCGRDMGIAELLEILAAYRKETDLPLFVRPNAGTPTRTADGSSYPLTPEKLAARLPELLKAGIAMFGGCCGTTPAHIAACQPIIDEWNRGQAPSLAR